ncbi:hypothetical protein K469DRAFT_109982 [Zopfia rhizophila CBS 207.26]|uniref:Uncharacterized protein n=1 Tax=Zopfia rhizophila CBS 207.26 TaxID=1314779 RepID=A0A6A6E8V2_9PEZI|nr:hypothetical protein K469DRAFT_109982 [Zopfia rhizophila CBS 207.26]
MHHHSVNLDSDQSLHHRISRRTPAIKSYLNNNNHPNLHNLRRHQPLPLLQIPSRRYHSYLHRQIQWPLRYRPAPHLRRQHRLSLQIHAPALLGPALDTRLYPSLKNQLRQRRYPVRHHIIMPWLRSRLFSESDDVLEQWSGLLSNLLEKDGWVCGLRGEICLRGHCRCCRHVRSMRGILIIVRILLGITLIWMGLFVTGFVLS